MGTVCSKLEFSREKGQSRRREKVPVVTWATLWKAGVPQGPGDVAGKRVVGGPGIFFTLWGMVGMRHDVPACFCGQPLVIVTLSPCRQGHPSALPCPGVSSCPGQS